MTDSEKELVEMLRRVTVGAQQSWMCGKAADAIETLVRERDFAVEGVKRHVAALQAAERERDEARAELADLKAKGWKEVADEYHQRTKAAEAEVARLRNIILWADGQIGEWPERQPGEGAYYWRKELMRRLEAKP